MVIDYCDWILERVFQKQEDKMPARAERKGGVLMMLFNSSSRESYFEMQDKVNKKLRSIRRGGMVLALCLIVLGVILLFCPVQAVVWVQRGIAAVLGLIGLLELIDYLSSFALFRQSYTIARGFLNLALAVLLLAVKPETTITLFSMMMGIAACMLGLHKLDYASKLNYFHANGSGLAMAGGLLSLAAGICFFLSPLNSALVLSTLVGAYCIIGGVALLIEMRSFKNL